MNEIKPNSWDLEALAEDALEFLGDLPEIVEEHAESQLLLLPLQLSDTQLSISSSGLLPQLPAGSGKDLQQSQPCKIEQAKEINRRAQRRFREKRKVRL